MEVKIVERQLNKLKAEFSLAPFQSGKTHLTVGDLILHFRLAGTFSDDYFTMDVMILDRLVPSGSDTIRECRISSKKLNMHQERYMSDDSKWRVLIPPTAFALPDPEEYIFDLTLESETILIRKPFALLCDDEEITDFELCAGDGSVQFHSTVLAAASQVLRAMLSGPWQETKYRRLQVEDTSKTTLQHLKDYLYLYKLPESGVEQLLLLASYYMMSELENQCIERLLSKVTTENYTELAKFALNNNMTKLFNAFLLMVKDGIIDAAILQGKEIEPNSSFKFKFLNDN